MTNRCLALIGALAGVIAVVSLALVPVAGQAQTAPVPRTPWGEPDLQGIWSIAAQIPLERPEEYAGRAFLTEEEVAELDRQKALDPGRNARAEPGSVGLSAIGAALQPVSTKDDHGLYLRLGPGGTTVIAPIAPGVVSPVEVAEWRTVAVGEDIDTAQEPGTVALDGERTFTLSGDRAARVTLTRNGPRVVGVAEVLRQATLAGVFAKLATSVNEVQP